MPVEVLQLVSLVPAVDAELHQNYSVCRWDELPDQERWLDQNNASIRAVVTGYERVDLEAARRRGVRVTNTPDVLTEDVADFAVGLMIATMRRIAAGDRFVRDGSWLSGGMDLASKVSGRRHGIVGLGRIGQAVARRLEGFGGSIAYTARGPKQVPYAYHATALDLAHACDTLIVTVAGGPPTQNLIGRAVLDALGPSGFLINVARGSIVSEPELIAALQEGRLGGAGLDVYADEPRVPAALAALPNVTLTPHIGSATGAARTAMARQMLANLDAFYAGRPLPSAVV
jgi:hydroxypyruvate reductase